MKALCYFVWWPRRTVPNSQFSSISILDYQFSSHFILDFQVPPFLIAFDSQFPSFSLIIKSLNSPFSSLSISNGFDFEFLILMWESGLTLWTVIVNGSEDDDCRLVHSIPNDMQTCGPNNQFESCLDDPVGNSYSSTLTVSSISPYLNGTSLECAGPAATTVIGTNMLADVSDSECMVTVRWSDPVISCNGSTSQHVLTVPPPTTECPSGDCVVGRGSEGFEEREQSVTLAVDQMYTFTVRADTCSNTQTGEESGQYTVEMEAHSESCQYSYEYDVRTLAIQAIQTTWRRVFLGPLGEAEYTLIINPGGLRQPVMSSDCDSAHYSYTYSPDGSGCGYCVSVEAVGCVTRVTECLNVSCNCDPNELVAGVEMVEIGYVFLEGRVTYNGTSENSTAMYAPNEDYSLSDGSNNIRVCQKRSWTGEGVSTLQKKSGRNRGDTGQCSCGAAVVTAGALCSVVSLTLGALLATLLHYLISTARGKPPTSPHPPLASYEEVEAPTNTRKVNGYGDERINLNGPVVKRIISSHNQAYGQVQL